MDKTRYKRIAPDSSVVNWMARQGRDDSVQSDPNKQREYKAIERLYELQEQGQIVLVGVDQVHKELARTNDEAKREKLLETLGLCRDKHYLTRFDSREKSKRASHAKGKVGINLGDGAQWITADDEIKIEEYIAFGDSSAEKRDMEVLATAAIARANIVVFIDKPFLSSQRVKDFAKQNDDIDICTPTQAIELLVQVGIAESCTNRDGT